MLFLSSSFFSLFLSVAYAFNFQLTPAAPASCDKLTVTWTGGTAPFTLNLIPEFGTPRAVSIPATAQGSFDVDQLPFARGTKIVVAMSDSTGFGAGGVSTLFNVAAGSGKTCVTKDPGVDFFYETPTAQLQQCQPYTFNGYPNAIMPIQIMGMVPGGQPFTLNPAANAAGFDWTANVKAGTTVIFMITDSKGRQGGSTKFLTVGNSANQACLNTNSPSSTPAGAPAASNTQSTSASATSKGDNNTGKHGSATKTSSSTATATSDAAAAASSGSTHAGAIAGSVIGVLIFLAALGTLFLFFYRRRQKTGSWSGATPLTDAAGGYPPAPLAKRNLPASENPFADPSPQNYYPSTPNSRTNLYGQASPLGSAYTPTTTAPQFPGLGASGYKSESQDAPNMSVQPPVTVNRYPDPEPYTAYPPPPASLSSMSYASAEMNRAPSAGSSSSGTMASQEKAMAAAAAAQRKQAPRFILHTDADDIEELPPSYSDRRAPGSAPYGNADMKSSASSPAPAPTPALAPAPAPAAASASSSSLYERPLSAGTLASLAYMSDAYAGDSFSTDDAPKRR